LTAVRGVAVEPRLRGRSLAFGKTLAGDRERLPWVCELLLHHAALICRA
jgi:hypothetical protein